MQRHIFFLLLVCSTGVVTGMISGKWQVHPAVPPARSKHGQVAAHPLFPDLIYFHGGRSPGGTTLGDMWTYNITSNVFSELKLHGTPPPPRQVHSLALVQNSKHPQGVLYVFGGLIDEQPTVAYDIYKIDPVSGLSLPLPSAIPGRWRHSTVALGSQMIICFGIDRGLRDDVWAFNTESEAWVELKPVADSPPPPEKRYHPCCQPVNTTAFVCFGGTLANVTDSSEVMLYDVNYRRWVNYAAHGTRGEHFPIPRNSAACFYHTHNQTFTISHGWSTAELVGFNDMWDFDLKTATWTKVTPGMQKQQSELIDSAFWTVMPNRKAYFFGGWGETTTLNSLWVHNMETRENNNLYASQEAPTARVLHCTVNVGEMVYVLLGASGATILTDVWKYDTRTSTWTQLAVDGVIIRLYAAACVVRGTIIFIFGGALSLTETTLSSDMFLIDTGSHDGEHLRSSLVILQAGSPQPTARYHAAATLFGGDNIVIMGGKGYREEPFDDVWVFEVTSSRWSEVQVGGGAGYLWKHGIVKIRTDALLILNGDDGVMSLDKRWLSYPQQSRSGSELKVFMNFSALNYESDPGEKIPIIKSDVVRVSATYVVGYNATRVLILGGSVDGTSTVELTSSHIYDTITRVNTVLPRPPFATTESQAAFVGNKVYLFGGRLMSKGIVFEEVSHMQIFTFEQDSICNGTNDLIGCITCPAGFFPPRCEPCPTHTYFDESTGACLPCVQGRQNKFTAIVGRASCTLVESDAKTNLTDGHKAVTRQQQPHPFQKGETPMNFWIAVIVVAGTSVLVIIFLIFGVSALQVRRRNKWLRPEMHEALEKVYTDIQGGGPEGIGERELFVLFHILATEQCRYFLTEEWISDLVQKYDADGSRQIELDEFEDMMIECCMNPKQDFNVDWARFGVDDSIIPAPMKPLPPVDDPRFEELIKEKEEAVKFKMFSLKSIDFFNDQHTVGALGEAMYIKATGNGGVATFCWIFGLVVIVIALTGQYVYENEEEERTSQPYLTLDFDIKSDLIATFSLGSSGYKTVGNITREETDAACRAISVQFGGEGGAQNVKVGLSRLSCKAGDGLFNITWQCLRCNLGSSAVDLSFTSAEDRMYASDLTLYLITTTGIPGVQDRSIYSMIRRSDHADIDEQVSYTWRTLSASPQEILRGLDKSSSFAVDMFPTIFGQKDDIDNGNAAKTSTGYHAYITGSKMNAIPKRNFLASNGLSIVVQFQIRGSSTLIVSRRMKQNLLIFLTGIVGAISGFVGACIAVMRFFVGRQLKERQELIRKDKKRTRRELMEMNQKGQLAAVSDNAPNVEIFQLRLDTESLYPIPGAPKWYTQVEKLMLAGLSFKMAKSLIESIEVLNEEAKQSVRPRTPVMEPIDSWDTALFGK